MSANTIPAESFAQTAVRDTPADAPEFIPGVYRVEWSRVGRTSDLQPLEVAVSTPAELEAAAERHARPLLGSRVIEGEAFFDGTLVIWCGVRFGGEGRWTRVADLDAQVNPA